MSDTIVQIQVTQQQAPTPNTLQRRGAMLSQGATDTSPGTYTLLTQTADLTPILTGAKPVTSITQSTGTATVTTSAHGFTVGDTIPMVIAGAAQAAYNGLHTVTIASTTTFTYTVPSGTTTPATGTIVYTPEDVTELLTMVTTFFGQGSSIGVYVLELGAGNANDGVTYLTAWITANPGFFYAYLVPRYWDGVTSYLALIATFESTTAKTYFWTTTTLATYTLYTNLMKSVWSMVEAPAYGAWPANPLTAISYSTGVVTASTTTAHGVLVGQWFQIAGVTPTGYNGWWQAQPGTTGSTLVYNVSTSLAAESVLGTLVVSYYASSGIAANEFTLAGAFFAALNRNPTGNSRAQPFAFTELSGVTPFPLNGNASTVAALKAANTNIVVTGSEGGITNAIIKWGTYQDGRPLEYWYAVDWVAINVQLNMANAVINGSNNPANPLLLNQAGIDTLQANGAATLSSGATFGMVLGTIVISELNTTDYANALALGTFAGKAVINAVPFTDYYANSPSDYRAGVYNGFAITFTPLRGFVSITVQISVTDFVG